MSVETSLAATLRHDLLSLTIVWRDPCGAQLIGLIENNTT